MYFYAETFFENKKCYVRFEEPSLRKDFVKGKLYDLEQGPRKVIDNADVPDCDDIYLQEAYFETAASSNKVLVKKRIKQIERQLKEHKKNIDNYSESELFDLLCSLEWND